MSRIDEAARLINASPERVFSALSTADSVAKWLPPRGMTATVEHFDATDEGTYRLVLTYDDAADAPGKSSANEDIVEGRFVEVTPGVRLVQEIEFESDDPRYAGVMRMTWEVRPSGAGSEVIFRAEDVPAGITASDHIEGLTSSLQNLADLVER
ncbi:SRPBCC domain-containing protein [Microbacterium sp.]|uniref:SRPBCC domain-containing protein n=1 Tax=Microbacterium sp. TaxID=51671 RepID=UPI0026142EC2|nr:SRPBCC domain-containing protein [Microbacterium sp.]